MMKFLRSFPVVRIFCGVSFFALLFAYIAQYVFHMSPCKLCIYQRVLYWSVFVISVSVIIFKFKNFSTYINYIMIFLLGLNAIVAFYHAGLELHIFSDLLKCSVDAFSGSISEMKKQLLDPKSIVSCSVPQLKLFGISMAGWNFIYLITSMLVIVVVGLHDEKEKSS